jgi:hypothetical protein
MVADDVFEWYNLVAVNKLERVLNKLEMVYIV